jgi:hypothetical protein
MKIFDKVVFMLLIALMISSCAANRKLASPAGTVVALPAGTGIAEGSLVYALPLTVVDISLETERIVEKPGPYARFAEDMLGLNNVIRSEAEHWEIKGITISTHQELDPSGFYAIEASPVFRTNIIAMKREGLILDINPEIYNTGKTIDQPDNKDINKSGAYDLGSDEYFKTKNDTVYKLLNVDTAFIRVPYLVEKKQKLSIDQLAEKAAARLMELRDGKHSILTGEANVFPQNEAAINEINRLEKEYTELFTGKNLKERRVFNYQVIPEKSQAGNKIVLCGFSQTSGPVISSGKGETQVIVEFLPESRTKAIELISKKQQSSSKSKYDRLFYRVPEVADIRVTYGNNAINTSRQLIYQLGEIIQLPANYIIGK